MGCFLKNLQGLLTIWTAISLVAACGRSEKKRVEDLSKEGRARIELAKQTIDQERLKDGIDISYRTNNGQVELGLAAIDWSKKTPEERAQIRQRLKSHVRNIDRIYEIGRQRNMTLDGNHLEQSRIYALEYIDSLDKFEAQHP